MRVLFLGDMGVLRDTSVRSSWPAPTPSDSGVRIVLNWELPIGVVSTRYKPLQLTAPASAIQSIHGWSGVVTSLTNNHALDAGSEGLMGTVSALTAAGAEVFGYYRQDGSASGAWTWEQPEGRLCVLPWVTADTTPVPNSLAGTGPIIWPGLGKAAQVVEQAKGCHDWVVIYIHWDIELFGYPSPATRRMARGLVEAGADLIIGHHPHVVRGRESLNGVEVYYSLGNYYFDDLPADTRGIARHQVGRNRESIGVLASFRRSQPLETEVVSFFQERGRPPERDAKKRGERRLRQASRALTEGSEETYALWYSAALSRFRRFEYRFRFRVLSLSFRGWLKLIRWRLSRLPQ